MFKKLKKEYNKVVDLFSDDAEEQEIKLPANDDKMELPSSGAIMYRPHKAAPGSAFKFRGSSDVYRVTKDGSIRNISKKLEKIEFGATKKQRVKTRKALNSE